ncbi:MAG: two-component system, response regulator YesN [Clostridiales bacterium]|jgi:two-component system response regulator YesN|nr:two-component system, response regulator YesN [Clostridiales bacterium]
MYKLILVDDEEEVRKGIVKKIDWGQYGFEIIGEAENGIEALEIAEKVVPDVVVTDIKMPFMDGLTLSKKLREKFPTTKIIILTGFDEFEYAQKAINLDIVEYILKPISSKEMIDMLVRVKAKIDEEIAQKKNIETLKEHYKKSLPLLKEKFLGSLITSRINKDEILEKSHNYGLNLHGKGFVVTALSADLDTATTINSDDRDGKHFKETTTFGISEGKEITKFAVLNISEEIVNKYGSGIVFLHNDYIVIIFTSENDNRDALMGKALFILEEIRQCMEKYHHFTVTIGVGTFCKDIVNISYSYENAITALDYRLILGNNRVICIEDVEPQCSKRVVFDELKERSLMSCIKVGTTEEIIETVEALFKEIMDEKTSFQDYQIYLLEILTTILKIAKDLNVDMDNLFGVNYNLFVEMYKFKDLKEVKGWLIGMCTKIKSFISKERKDTCKLLVKRATEYLNHHYHENDITIDKICKLLYISPTYFSTIFKKETKLTFVNYLTHVRMEAAKELLRSTDLKTFEIAQKVGYSEPNYFSYCFKKIFGISPSEYRKAFKPV